MKKILLIGTGGTIASDVTANGLAPELTTEQLLEHLPGVSEICDVDCVQLLNLDSTNIAPEHWLQMARCIRERYGRYDGFVLTHGTDTMAYTAAALSYLIQGSPKPIVLTGAQKPIGFDSTDSKINLLDALRCASEDLPGVSIVFNNRVILGTRARKTRTKSFQAFSSINYPYLGMLRDGVLLRYIRQDCAAYPVFYDALDTKVAWDGEARKVTVDSTVGYGIKTKYLEKSYLAPDGTVLIQYFYGYPVLPNPANSAYITKLNNSFFQICSC